MEHTKEQFILCAFLGFQLGAGEDKKFGEYLEALGLVDKKPETMANITKEEALAKAKRIREKIKGIKGR